MENEMGEREVLRLERVWRSSGSSAGGGARFAVVFFFVFTEIQGTRGIGA